MEFYLCQAFDLLYERVPVTIDQKTSKPVGLNFMEITKPSDIATFVEEVYNNRKVSSTKMNAGSSRSHVALILTLHQYSKEDINPQANCEVQKDIYTSTSFTFMDFAGSERVSKTGGQRVSALEAMSMASSGKPVPTGAEGTMINYELTCLSTEVVKATELHTAKKR